jgi:N-acetylneuraminic acid mutarotase
MKESVKRVKKWVGMALALVWLINGFAMPGYCLRQQGFDQATTPPAANSSWTFTGSLNATRYSHTATLLASGKVLVAGGGGWLCNGTFPTSYSCITTVNSSAELYDPNTETWSYTGRMSRRASHSATSLVNGQVLVAGGVNWGDGGTGGYELVNSAELYDPSTGKWRPTGSLNKIRGSNSATLLANGKVLAVGYSDIRADHVDRDAELYDPLTGTWETTGSPGIIGSMILLPNGKVLNVSGSFAELYDPNTGAWRSTGKLNILGSTGTVTLLGNGKVLVTGRTSKDNSACGAELYDPDTQIWSITGSPDAGYGTATLLSDGRVLAAGGYDSDYDTITRAQLYDPDTGTWSSTSHLNIARVVHTATLLADGRVLATGGIDGDFDIGTIFHSSAELYGPIAIPKITGASVSGKNLFVRGEDFKPGAIILLNGEEQKTRNDDQIPKTTLIGKKAGKKIKPGDRLQVRNPNGSFSEEFTFTGS